MRVTNDPNEIKLVQHTYITGIIEKFLKHNVKSRSVPISVSNYKFLTQIISTDKDKVSNHILNQPLTPGQHTIYRQIYP